MLRWFKYSAEEIYAQNPTVKCSWTGPKMRVARLAYRVYLLMQTVYLLGELGAGQRSSRAVLPCFRGPSVRPRPAAVGGGTGDPVAICGGNSSDCALARARTHTHTHTQSHLMYATPPTPPAHLPRSRLPLSRLEHRVWTEGAVLQRPRP